MRKFMLPVILLIVGGIITVKFAGVRLIVVGPMIEFNKAPATLFVSGLDYGTFLVSPQAVCAKQGKPDNDFCAAGTLYGMMNNATLIARLPYIPVLYGIACGA